MESNKQGYLEFCAAHGETEGDEYQGAKEQPEMVDSTSRNHNIAGIPPSRFHRWESVNSQALSGLCLEKGYSMEILLRW